MYKIGLDEDIKMEDMLNIFKFDLDWEVNEVEYKKLKV